MLVQQGSKAKRRTPCQVLLVHSTNCMRNRTRSARATHNRSACASNQRAACAAKTQPEPTHTSSDTTASRITHPNRIANIHGSTMCCTTVLQHMQHSPLTANKSLRTLTPTAETLLQKHRVRSHYGVTQDSNPCGAPQYTTDAHNSYDRAAATGCELVWFLPASQMN